MASSARIGPPAGHQIIAALDRVEGVPFGFVFLHVAQCGADAALGRAGMAADGIELGENRRFGFLAGFQCGVKTGTAGADDHRVELMDHKHLLLVGPFYLPHRVSMNGRDNRFSFIHILVGAKSPNSSGTIAGV
jgi:hypothetical protein